MKSTGIPAVFCLALTMLFCGRPALAADHAPPLICPAFNSEPIAPNAIHGAVTRIQINPKAARSMAYTIHPALEDQDLAVWMRRLEETGVNIAELVLLPADKLSAEPSISSTDWQAYIDAALIPSFERTPTQRDSYKAARDRIAGQNGVKNVTADQQDQILLTFLDRLETLKKKGRICGNVQFVVVERRWFPTAPESSNADLLKKRLSSEIVYAQTMADFVNHAIENHLGHWLAGILFAEHTNTDMNQLLPIAVDLAVRINGLTHNWLQSHLMIAAGGGLGDQFNGIGNVICPDGGDKPDAGYQFTCSPGRPFDFFGLISKQTGSFAFGYKLFNWKTAPTPLSYCEAYRSGCAPKNLTVADWTDYLNDATHGLGFSDLATFVNTGAAAYPAAANVIFIGNSTDSIFKMVKVVSNSSGNVLTPLPQFTALATLFQNAARKGGGWSGRMFMDAYGDQDRIADPDHAAIDDGSYLFFVDHSPYDFTGNGKVSANLQSQAFWRAWPQLPEALATPQ
jgi:hypothetical protein